MKHLITLVFALILTACGGGGSDPSQPAPVTPPAPPAPIASKLVIAEAYGDSTMYGAILPNYAQSATNPPTVAQQVLRDTVDTLMQVKNEAISGTNSVQLLAGTDGAHGAWALQMASSAANIVIINHAINDVQLHTPSDVYHQNLVTLIQVAKQAGKTVVMDTPNPVATGGSLSSRVDPVQLADYASIMRQVAAEQGADLCDIDKAVRDAKMDTLAFIPDGVHPNDALYEFEGKTLAACLAPIVKKLL